MQKSRLIAIGFLALCGLLVFAVSQGWIGANAPVALFPTALPATPDPSRAVTIELVYSAEKERWLAEAVKQWEATGPTADGRPIKVVLTRSGSQEIIANLGKTLKPAALSPASSLQIAQINAATIENTQNIAADSQPLVFTPLVLVGVKETTADTLKADSSLWTMVHDKVIEPDRSKKLLFGQTSPVLSHSGLQTWLLMAYAYHNKTSGLTAADINNPEFQSWISEYATNVEKFGTSTGTFMENMIRFGPSNYHAAAVYESSAIENIPLAINRQLDMYVIYPPANMWSDHPFAVLSAPWVTAEQKDAAGQLRAFLLGKPQQEAAVLQGFRPSDPDIALDIANSPFVAYADRGIKTNVGELVGDPSPEVVQALLDTWTKLQGNVQQ
ncbi:MAG TPA: substrate-binding domain-containing protein [Herpetosiphonaceae bacterium]|nr:substrate-binding domain-containing protein [Herpetosiphonaceae bacterium]